MKIVLKNGAGEIEEKKSRFIAHVYSVSNEEEAEKYINAVKKKYWDARHNCYAYVIGENSQIQRFSDDGEPQGTAGKPILDIISTSGLVNCLIIVTRYFGGVLLGTGGLIRAYQAASKAGLEASEIAEVSEGITAVIVTDYNAYGKIQYICNELGVSVTETEFAADVTMKIVSDDEKKDVFIKKITDAFSGNVVMEDEKNVKFCKKKSGEIIIL